MAYEIEVTARAKRDLADVKFHIAHNYASPLAAASLIDAVFACFEMLAAMPYIFEECRQPSLKRKQYRRAVIRNYILIYHVSEPTKTVRILRFLHGSQDYEKVL